MTGPALPPDGLGVLERFLSYVDRPWKIAAIAALAVIGLVSITVWEKRTDIAESILHSTVTPRLEPSRFKKLVQPLMDETGADVALLLSVQLTNNLAHIVGGIRRGDPGWMPPAGPRPIFTGTNPETVVQLIQGSVECFAISSDSPSQTTRDMAALGITHTCIISVPPVIDVLVGGLVIGWKIVPDAQAEAGAKAEMRRAANRLATW